MCAFYALLIAHYHDHKYRHCLPTQLEGLLECEYKSDPNSYAVFSRVVLSRLLHHRHLDLQAACMKFVFQA